MATWSFLQVRKVWSDLRHCVFIQTSLELSAANWYSGLYTLDGFHCACFRRKRKTRIEKMSCERERIICLLDLLLKGTVHLLPTNGRGTTYITQPAWLLGIFVFQEGFRFSSRKAWHIKPKWNTFWNAKLMDKALFQKCNYSNTTLTIKSINVVMRSNEKDLGGHSSQ